MPQFTIYHNPRCSKSRETLALLEANAITPNIVLYLETPPARDDIRRLLDLLGISARDLLRTAEEAYRTLGLGDTTLSEDALIDAMIREPKLIQRPIVVSGDAAVIGRPPENVLPLIDAAGA